MDGTIEGFLRSQPEQALPLAAESDLLDLVQIDPQHFVADFYATGLVRARSGEIRESRHFQAGFWFPETYCREVDPLTVVTWLAPSNVFHPNIGPPLVCLGDIKPGTPLVDLLFRTFEVITYQNVTMDEHDAFNRDACVWARAHLDRLPIDARPLKWRAPRTRLEPTGGRS